MFISHHAIKWKACVFAGIRCRAFAGRHYGCLSAPEATSNVRGQAYRCLCRIPGTTVDNAVIIGFGTHLDRSTVYLSHLDLLTHIAHNSLSFLSMDDGMLIDDRGTVRLVCPSTSVAQRANAFAPANRTFAQVSKSK